jgi:hypothetical protein
MSNPNEEKTPLLSSNPINEQPPPSPPEEAKDLDSKTTSELLWDLFDPKILKKPPEWFSTVWALLTSCTLEILCIVTFILMNMFDVSKRILAVIYLFIAIFWGFFPYFLKDILIYNAFKISGLPNSIYAGLGIFFWFLGLMVYV